MYVFFISNNVFIKYAQNNKGHTQKHSMFILEQTVCIHISDSVALLSATQTGKTGQFQNNNNMISNSQALQKMCARHKMSSETSS